MRSIDKMVLRKIWRMKLRTLGISLVVSVAAAMFITGLYTADVLDYSTEQFVKRSKMPDLFIEFANPVNASEVSGILESKGVTTYDLRLKVMGMYSHDGELYPAIIIGVANPARRDINVNTLDRGRFFQAPGECVAISGSEGIGAKTGAQVQFLIVGKALNLTVTGTAKSPEYAMAGYMAETSVPLPGNIVVAFMSLGELQGATRGGINDATLLLPNGVSGQDVVDGLSHLSVTGVTYQHDHPTVVLMKMGVNKMRYMMPMLSFIFMAVGFISILMTVYRLVMNDSRFIGVLMSLGYTRGRIVMAYMLLGGMLALVGGAMGLLLSLLFTYLIAGVTVDFIGSISLEFPLSPLPFVYGLLFTFGAVMISVAIPVVLITRTSVRDALDSQPKTKVFTTRVGAQALSRTALMGIRNSTRNPLRLLMTVLVVGMTIGVAGSWLTMADSAYGYIQKNMDSETWDLRADFFTPVPRASVGLIASQYSNETEYVIPYTVVMGQVAYGEKDTSGALVGCDEMGRVKSFDVQAGRSDLSGAIITNKLSKELGAGVGDQIELKVGSETTGLKVTGVVSDIILQAVYTQSSNLAAFFPQSNCSGIYIKLKDPGNVQEVAKELRQSPMITKVTIKSDITKSMGDLLGQAQSLLYTFFFVSIAITFVVSASAVIISTMERDLEFATLDSMGITKAQVAKSIIIEMAILGVLSALAGVPFAYLFANIFAYVMAQILFYYPVVFVLGATILIFMTGLSFVLLSAVVPIRYSAKVDTEKTIRERTAG